MKRGNLAWIEEGSPLATRVITTTDASGLIDPLAVSAPVRNKCVKIPREKVQRPSRNDIRTLGSVWKAPEACHLPVRHVDAEAHQQVGIVAEQFENFEPWQPEETVLDAESRKFVSIESKQPVHKCARFRPRVLRILAIGAPKPDGDSPLSSVR